MGPPLPFPPARFQGPAVAPPPLLFLRPPLQVCFGQRAELATVPHLFGSILGRSCSLIIAFSTDPWRVITVPRFFMLP